MSLPPPLSKTTLRACKVHYIKGNFTGVEFFNILPKICFKKFGMVKFIKSPAGFKLMTYTTENGELPN